MIIKKIVQQFQIIIDDSASLEDRLCSINLVKTYVLQLNLQALLEKDFLLSLIDTIIELLMKEQFETKTILTLTNLLMQKLHLTSDHDSRMIICGHGLLADTVTKLLSEKYHVIPLDYLQKEQLIQYEDTYFIICASVFDSSCLSTLPKSSIIHLHNYLQFQYMLAPELYLRKWQFDHLNRPVKGIITGISYFRDAIHTEYLEESFGSLANRSQDLFYDYALFRYGHRRYPTIQYAIVGIAPYSFHFDESKSKTLLPLLFSNYAVTGTAHQCSEFEPYKAIYHDEREKVTKFFSPEMIHELYLDAYVTQFVHESFRASTVFEEAGMTSEALIQAQAEMYEKYENPCENTLNEYKKIFFDYLSYLKENRIKTLILLPPLTHWYKDHWNTDYYNETLEIITSYQKVFQFHFLDLTTLNLPDYYFRDYAHVNEIGAIYVASKINPMLKKMRNYE